MGDHGQLVSYLPCWTAWVEIMAMRSCSHDGVVITPQNRAYMQAIIFYGQDINIMIIIRYQVIQVELISATCSVPTGSTAEAIYSPCSKPGVAYWTDWLWASQKLCIDAHAQHGQHIADSHTVQTQCF